MESTGSELGTQITKELLWLCLFELLVESISFVLDRELLCAKKSVIVLLLLD